MNPLKKIFFLVISIFFSVKSQSQNLPVPSEFSKAVDKGTRTNTGFQGSGYWQNHSDYKIKVALDPKIRLIKGSETIIYENKSPDDLSQLVIRLYPDIFKRENTRDDRDIDSGDINEKGVIIEKITINGKIVTNAKRQGTNMFVPLLFPLKSKTNMTVEVSWSYKIPKTSHIREGTYFGTSFVVAYWYPQISVYDDIDGWDVLDYTGSTEFYNDFNNYEVEVTAPNSHLVWATGVWQNPEEILSPVFLDRYKTAQTADNIVKIVTDEDRKKGNLTVGKEFNTYKYKAENVTDFVFTASDSYLWDMSSVIVDDVTKRRTAVGAAYHPSSNDFYEVTGYARQSVDFFSHKLPGIPFPYPNLTVFNGHGGMEFPMMVNDGSFDNKSAAEVTAHEIAHTYFPFYMGINERKYAWMDEGWAQTLPNDMEFNIGDIAFKPQQDNSTYFLSYVMQKTDVPLMTPAYKAGPAYWNYAYFKPSLAYLTLKNMLGDELFGKTLREYMNRWHGKHPQPSDFFNSFNDYLKEDLTWFWKPWFFEVGIPDLGISEAKVENNKLTVTIVKKGNLPLPVILKINYQDGSYDRARVTAFVWKDKNVYTFTYNVTKKVENVVLGNEFVPDARSKDNVYEVKKEK